MHDVLNKEEPHRPLAQTPLFWISLLLPSLLGITLSLFIYDESPVGGLCFSPSCVAYFLELYKVPLAISGLSLPFVAMVASLHRSKEAHLQIKVGQAQYNEALKNNIFGNFLKHRDGFFDVLDRYASEESDDPIFLKIDNAALYAAVFPQNSFAKLEYTGQGAYWDMTCAAVLKFAESLDQCVNGSCSFLELLQRYETCVNAFHLSLEKASWRKHELEKLYIMLPNQLSEAASLYSLTRKIFSLHERIANYMGIEAIDSYDLLKNKELLPYFQANSSMLHKIN